MVQLTAQGFPFPSNLFRALSKQECETCIELMHYAVQAQSIDDLRETLTRAQELLPFDHLIAGRVCLGQGGTFEGFSDVINVSYPEEWLYLYWKNRYAEVDPVLRAMLQSNRAQLWRDVYSQDATSAEEKNFMRAAAGIGLDSGITTGSLDSSCGFATFFAFAGGLSAEHRRYLQFVEYLGQHLHLALVRSTPTTAAATQNCVADLSPREVTVLNWMKTGKTNWEIAQIVGLSERTVRFHVESIFAKLDVTSRVQAVATAVQHGLPNLM